MWEIGCTLQCPLYAETGRFFITEIVLIHRDTKQASLQPKATISTVFNVAATSLESALPTSKSASTMLAPEEVFAPSSSGPRARSELTPGEKRALRTRERKARKKSRDALDKGVDKFSKVKGIGGVKKQKEAALKSVVKTGKGITVIGKKTKDITGEKNRTRY